MLKPVCESLPAPSFFEASIRSEMLMPFLGGMSPSAKDCANCFSAPPSVDLALSYIARRCGSESVSYAFCMLAHSVGSPPRSGWLSIAFSLYALRISSVDAVRDTFSNA